MADRPETGTRAAAPGEAAIEDYALVGDCHGAALVSRGGSVDWCCLGRFDAEPVFCRLLDARKGGFLSVTPAGRFDVERAYLGATNILETVFATPAGKARVIDFMPVGRQSGAGVHDYVSLSAPHWLVRVLEGVEGSVDLAIDYRPTPDFARRPARLAHVEGRIEEGSGLCLHADLPFEPVDGRAHASVTLEAGERRALVLTPRPTAHGAPLARVPELMRVTRAFWEEWIAYLRYGGPYGEAVRRSALALKLMTYAPTGAMVAAPTTSLPEALGGSRNWDYRYCWLRDTVFAFESLAAVGYGGEARRFAGFLRRACEKTRPDVRIMYGIGAETRLEERELDHLDGYRDSRPVRTGNGAHDQKQIDIYGEVLDWAHLFRSLGGRFDPPARAMLEGLAETMERRWREPDQGLWEMRGPPRHHVFGKLMSWVAADRAARLFGGERWTDLRDAIAEEIRARGVDATTGRFRGAYERDGLDAALLLLPVLDFPVAAGTLERTVDAVRAELGHNDFLRRYAGDDGLEGEEGAFVICSFWLVDALLCLGRRAEAQELFERLLGAANDVGLYAEEIDPGTGAFLGNFPQAFSHLALIGSAVKLRLHETGGAAAIVGTKADRARRGVRAVHGWRAVLAAMWDCGRLGRIFSSRNSVLSDLE